MPILTSDERVLDTARAVREYLRIFQQRYGLDRYPTDIDLKKSALLERLLSGKPALPYPPPTQFSYPAYGLVEDAGPWYPFDVWERPNPDGDAVAQIVIEQCPWYARREDPAVDSWLVSWLPESARLAARAPLYRLTYVAEGLAEGDTVPGSEEVQPGGLKVRFKREDGKVIEGARPYHAFRLEKVPEPEL